MKIIYLFRSAIIVALFALAAAAPAHSDEIYYTVANRFYDGNGANGVQDAYYRDLVNSAASATPPINKELEAHLKPLKERTESLRALGHLWNRGQTRQVDLLSIQVQEKLKSIADREKKHKNVRTIRVETIKGKRLYFIEYLTVWEEVKKVEAQIAKESQKFLHAQAKTARLANQRHIKRLFGRAFGVIGAVGTFSYQLNKAYDAHSAVVDARDGAAKAQFTKSQIETFAVSTEKID